MNNNEIQFKDSTLISEPAEVALFGFCILRYSLPIWHVMGVACNTITPVAYSEEGAQGACAPQNDKKNF